jgi:hypothetical protein
METINSFARTLAKTESQVKKMQQTIEQVRQMVTAGNMEQAYEAALLLEELSERTTLLTRTLPAYTGCPAAAAEVENLLQICIPVDIGFTAEGWFCLRIPALLPKKSEGSASYIRSFLYPAMQAFFRNAPPIRYRDCVLTYRHVYDRTRPERRHRDHDNIELNMVTDIVALYVLKDDAPTTCCHYYCSAAASGDRTEVYVVPRDEFPQWLVTEKAIPDEGVMLHENNLLWGEKTM